MAATLVALRDQKIIFKGIILIFFMVRGEVLWYNKKGFGLAKDENDREIFLHNSNFKFRGELRQGETVFFRVTNEKGRLTGMEIEKKRRPKNTENFNPSDRAPQRGRRSPSGPAQRRPHASVRPNNSQSFP